MARDRLTDRFTGDLFEWQPPKVAAGFPPEQLPGTRLASRISRAVGLALKECRRPRAEIAAAMSAELGYQVSGDMLDAYASEAKEGHRITLDRFIALIGATGCTDLIALVAEPSGFIAVPERYASLIELHLIDEHERKLTLARQAAEAKWRAGR